MSDSRAQSDGPRAGSGRGDAALVAALMIAVLLASLAALPAFGIAWDEGLGDLFFGHRYLWLWTQPGAAALDFQSPLPAADGDGTTHPDLFLSPLRTRPHEHWPVMATLSAALCETLSRRLGWIDPVDAHHLAGPLVVAALLPVLWIVARPSFGRPAALAGVLTLLLHPRFATAAWTDLKDTGSAVFVSAALLLAAIGLRTPSAGAIYAAAFVAGLALGTKANAWFLPLPLLLFVAISWRQLPALGGRERWAVALSPAIAGLVMLGSWPWLWEAPLERLALNASYVVGRGAAGSPWPNLWPLGLVLGSWPLASLPLLLAGVAQGLRSLRRRDARLEGLLLLGAALPLARLMAPGSLSFDGYRHALELVPPAALLAGAGARRWLSGRLRAPLLCLLVLEPGLELYAAHPFGMAHMSPLVGGIGGAKRLGVPGLEDYWATSYRRGLAWVEAHAEPEAAVGAAVAGHLLELEAPLRLRPARSLLRASSPFEADPGPVVLHDLLAETGERPVYLLYVLRDAWRGPVVRLAETHLPVYTEGPASSPLFKIVRLPAPIAARPVHRIYLTDGKFGPILSPLESPNRLTANERPDTRLP